MAKKVNRAGLIPYVKEEGEILMLFMKPSNKKFGGASFQIAKGKQEENEELKETALREAKEELGLFKGNVGRIDELGVWLGRTTVFVCEVKKKDMFGDPHYETGGTKWMTLEEFEKEGRSIHIPVVKAAHRKITKTK